VVAAPSIPQAQPATTPPATTTTTTSAVETQQTVAPQPATKQEKPRVTEREARDARAAAAKAASRQAQTRVPPSSVVKTQVTAPSVIPKQEPLPAPPPSVVTTAPVVPPPQRQETTPPKQEVVPTAPVPPTAADIAPAVEALARAIESKDIGAIRRVYPGLTGDQQRRFEQFFDAARTINASFSVANVASSGPATADAQLVGAYEYVTTAGKTERQPVRFAITLGHDSGRWRLTSMR
jgi:hypothetical protein